MALVPAVKNGVLLQLVKPGGGVRWRAFDGPLPVKPTIGGVAPVTEVSLIGGIPFTCLNPVEGLSAKTAIEGVKVVLLGAEVRDADGFIGIVEPQHCTGLNVVVG